MTLETTTQFSNIPNNANSQIYELTFRAPVHFGEDSSGLERGVEFLHSDSLFSAICRAWATIYGSRSLEEELLRPCESYGRGETEAAPLLVSSTFVFSKGRYYLPKPLIDLGWEDQNYFEDGTQDIRNVAKLFKEAQFIEAEKWKRWFKGETIFVAVDRDEASFKQYKKAFEFSLTTRSLVPRAREGRADTVPYVCQQVRFKQESGLYFIAVFDPAHRDRVQARLEGVLDLLKDVGIGGERSSGYGHFSWKPSEISVKSILGQLPSDPIGYVTLSLASVDYSAQTKQEETPLAEDWRYHLVRRRGYTSPMGGNGEQRRWKNILMLGEGSSCATTTPPRGQLFNVTPPVNWNGTHQVYRSGLAVVWPYRQSG